MESSLSCNKNNNNKNKSYRVNNNNNDISKQVAELDDADIWIESLVTTTSSSHDDDYDGTNTSNTSNNTTYDRQISLMNEIGNAFYELEYNYLRCNHCNNIYIAPVNVIPCQHVFCSYCIRIKLYNDTITNTTHKASCSLCNTIVNTSGINYIHCLVPNQYMDIFVTVYRLIRSSLLNILKEQLSLIINASSSSTTTTTDNNHNEEGQDKSIVTTSTNNLTNLLQSIQNATRFIQLVSTNNSTAEDNDTNDSSSTRIDVSTILYHVKEIICPILHHTGGNIMYPKLPKPCIERRPTIPKVIYNGKSRKQLIQLCIDIGIRDCIYNNNTLYNDDETTIRKKHVDFCILYNSECDTYYPRTKQQLMTIFQLQYNNIIKEKSKNNTSTTTTTNHKASLMDNTKTVISKSKSSSSPPTLTTTSRTTTAATTTTKVEPERKAEQSSSSSSCAIIDYNKCIQIIKQQRKILGEATINSNNKFWNTITTGCIEFDIEFKNGYQNLIDQYYQRFPKQKDKQNLRIQQFFQQKLNENNNNNTINITTTTTTTQNVVPDTTLPSEAIASNYIVQSEQQQQTQPMVLPIVKNAPSQETVTSSSSTITTNTNTTTTASNTINPYKRKRNSLDQQQQQNQQLSSKLQRPIPIGVLDKFHNSNNNIMSLSMQPVSVQGSIVNVILHQQQKHLSQTTVLHQNDAATSSIDKKDLSMKLKSSNYNFKKNNTTTVQYQEVKNVSSVAKPTPVTGIVTSTSTAPKIDINPYRRKRNSVESKQQQHSQPISTQPGNNDVRNQQQNEQLSNMMTVHQPATVPSIDAVPYIGIDSVKQCNNDNLNNATKYRDQMKQSYDKSLSNRTFDSSGVVKLIDKAMDMMHENDFDKNNMTTIRTSSAFTTTTTPQTIAATTTISVTTTPVIQSNMNLKSRIEAIISLGKQSRDDDETVIVLSDNENPPILVSSANSIALDKKMINDIGDAHNNNTNIKNDGCCNKRPSPLSVKQSKHITHPKKIKRYSGNDTIGHHTARNVVENSLIGPWSCKHCTYYNIKDRSSRARCEMCNNQR